MVRLYHWLLHEQTGGGQSLLQNVTFAITFPTLDKMNGCFALMALGHLLGLLWNCYVSFKAGEFYFGDPSRQKILREEHPLRSTADLDEEDQTCCMSTVYCCVSSLEMVYEYVMAKWLEPVFYLHGKYFDDYFLFRECAEVAAQVYQAYQMSVYVATRWINNLFVGMIFLNCVSTPIVHRLVPPSNMPLRRLISVTVSTFLNFINAVVIPLIIFRKYMLLYDPTTKNFPAKYLWDDVWYVKAVHENQQLFVTSSLDFVTTLTPHWSLMSCLRTFQGLVRRQNPMMDHCSDKKDLNNHPGARVTPAPKTDPAKAISSPSITMVRPAKPKPKCKQTLDSIVCNLLLLSGMIASCFHIYAQWQSPELGCKLIATPWFTRKISCVVMDVNCHKYGIDGNETQLQTILQKLNGNTMVTLLMTHCPRLQMPPTLHHLHQLSTLEIYNCTLDEWRLEASLRTEFYPRLTFFNVIRTNLSSVPPGLMDSQVPSRQTLFRETNLTNLPSNLHETWTSAVYLGFEYCHFLEIPSTLFHLQQQVEYLSFLGNPINFLPANESLKYPSLYGLTLSKTRLTELPNTTIANLDNVHDLYLEYTRLEEVPVEVRLWYQARVGDVGHSLFGSPYCDRQFAQDAEEVVYQSQVCHEDLGGLTSWYPMEFMESQRLP